MIFKHKELIDACVLNDRSAQMDIYNLYYKAMYNTSYYIVNDSFVAEDIMQDAFLDAFNKIAKFEWRSSFGSWLKRIVVNKSIDSMKKTTNQVELNEELVDFADDNDEDTFDELQSKLDEIKISLKSLSENYRTILVLHLFEGYDHQEISQILNLPYNNVRVRYMRAKRKLIEGVIKLAN
ncbi:MAG: RNA polymerase sigma factor [Bacteroidota bacterium]